MSIKRESEAGCLMSAAVFAYRVGDKLFPNKATELMKGLAGNAVVFSEWGPLPVAEIGWFLDEVGYAEDAVRVYGDARRTAKEKPEWRMRYGEMIAARLAKTGSEVLDLADAMRLDGETEEAWRLYNEILIATARVGFEEETALCVVRDRAAAGVRAVTCDAWELMA